MSGAVVARAGRRRRRPCRVPFFYAFLRHSIELLSSLCLPILAMSFRPPYRYITATNLATLLQKSSPTLPRREVAIVDVRDEDFEGGNIVGCRNIPSTVFDDRVKDLVDELKSGEQPQSCPTCYSCCPDIIIPLPYQSPR